MVNHAQPAPVMRYQARNVINATAIKEQLQRRSQEREDTPEIQAWITSHFYRYVIGNFQAEQPHVIPIHTPQDLTQLLGSGVAVPEWVTQRLTNQETLWWIIPDSPPLLAVEERILEFLCSREGTSLEGKLQRINCPQALARSMLEHLAFEKQRQLNRYQHQPSAVKKILERPAGVFVELQASSPELRHEMAFESQVMRHCLGQFSADSLTGGYGENYAKACESGKLRLFSFSNHNQQPHITLSVHVRGNGQLELDQIKGKQNRPPIERYQQDVLALLNHLTLNEHMPDDALNMWIIRLPDGLLDETTPAWRPLNELQTEREQLWLLRSNPYLLPYLDNKQPILYWYALGLQKNLLPLLQKNGPALSDALQVALAYSGKS